MRRILIAASLGLLGLGLAPAGASPVGDPGLPGDPPGTCAAEWPMYGADAARTFSNCSEIGPGNVATLTPKWVVKTNKTVTASPAVAGGRLFVGDWSGTMYALDAETGEELWTRSVQPASGAAFGPVVSSAAVGTAGTEPVVAFGAGPRLYVVRATDGQDVTNFPLDLAAEFGLPADTAVEIESSPVIHDGHVYVGTDPHNRPQSGRPGGLLKVSLDTGEIVDEFLPELGADEGCGGIWSSPVIDAEHGRAYVAGANCPRPSAGWDWTPYVEAVTALDLDTLEPIWSFQPHTVPNNDDHDFGATPNLFQLDDGTWVVGAGNKDGHYYVLDAATGVLVNDVEVGDDGYVQNGFAIGGFLGSPAVWNGRVYGGTAIPTPQDRDGSAPFAQTLQGVYAGIDPAGGTVDWRGVQAPTYAASAATNGLIFHGALDNVFRAYDAETGIVRWAAPLLGPISSGAAIVGDAVYIGSGTSSSDACQKEIPEPFHTACVEAFDTGLGATGGIHAFELAL